MATAKLEKEVVETIVKVVKPLMISVELSLEEALILKEITGCIGGGTGTYRQYTNDIYDSLDKILPQHDDMDMSSNYLSVCLHYGFDECMHSKNKLETLANKIRKKLART